MSLIIITLLVALTLYAIYFYDKMYNNGQKRLNINKYVKSSAAPIQNKILQTKRDKKRAAVKKMREKTPKVSSSPSTEHSNDKINNNAVANPNQPEEVSSTLTDDKTNENKAINTNNNYPPVLLDVIENGALILEAKQLTGIIDNKIDWDLRTTSFKKYGYVGLIEKGSKQISALAKIEKYHGPLSKESLKKNKHRHGILIKDINQNDFKKTTAIEFTSVTALDKPVSYEHKPGAVMWVKVGEQPLVIEQLLAQMK